MQIIYLPDVLDDLVWFHHYYSSVFPEGAKSALRQFDLMEDILSGNPFIGQHVYGEVRRLPIPRTPFTCFYRITDLAIEVLRIWDDRRGYG